MTTTAAELRARAFHWPKGQYFEDFTIERRYEHHWGRTLTATDNVVFNALTINANPSYFNREFARQHGAEDVRLNPMLVFLTVFGLSVEDLSETGVAFLGVDDLTFHVEVAVGDTVTARSTVVSARASGSHPNRGIVTWRTEGLNQNGEVVIDFLRTNLVNTRKAYDELDS